MTNFFIGMGFGIAISTVVIYFSLPPNKETIATFTVPSMDGDKVTNSQTFTVPPDVKTITITVGPMGGGGPVHDETPAQIPDERP